MTRSAGAVTFGPYRLDPTRPRLWKGDEPIALQPRPLSVLCYLAARPGEVVGRDELIQTLWAGTYVTRGVLKVAVRAVREALGDDVESARYIETVGREGYRFVAGADASAVTPPAVGTTVGRERELTVLRDAFEQAAGGVRRVVFVAGEGGIGKTTLIERLLTDVERDQRAWVARGQCLEQYGGGEAYLPFLEAIGRLARGERASEIARILRRHAPTWLSQLPALDVEPTTDGEAIATRPARMIREMTDALEVITRDRTLVLVLEDLHWSDPSTIDLIAYVARQRETARLLLIGAFRPADLIVHDHPLRHVRQDLQARGQCEVLALEPLTPADVQAYVDARFGGATRDQLRRLATHVHERTDGHALFMVDTVNDLVARETLVWRDGRWRVQGSITETTSRTPAGLRELIERRLETLTPAMRAAVEAASVVGDEFTVAAVAAALGEPRETLEESFEKLAAQGMLIDDAGVAESPDGTLAGRYRFLHALYRHVLYESIGAARRSRLHRTIGLHEEQLSAAGRAAELAMHFERGRDWERAVQYHELAGTAALARHAPHEAAGHFGAALEALAHLSEGAERTERELALVLSRATLLMTTHGYAAPETERAFARARSLCDVLQASPKIFPVLRGLLSYRQVRGELADADDLGRLLLRHAASPGADRALLVQAHYGHGATLFHMGQLDAARAHFEEALVAYDPVTHAEHMRVYGGYDPGVACSVWLGWTLGLLGRLEEAVIRDREGFDLARRLGHPFSLAWACYAHAVFEQMFGDYVGSATAADEAVHLAEEHGFPYILGMATVQRGWAVIMQGNPVAGIQMLRDGVAAVDATGAALVRPQYLGFLAAADAIEGHFEAGLARIEEALAEVERTDQRLHEVPLLIGKTHLLSGKDDLVEGCLRRALDVARHQGARVLELRVAVALARHLRERGRAREARPLLGEALAWFAEAPPAFPHIVAARRLLAELVPDS